jgi:hypothetical protein
VRNENIKDYMANLDCPMDFYIVDRTCEEQNTISMCEDCVAKVAEFAGEDVEIRCMLDTEGNIWFRWPICGKCIETLRKAVVPDDLPANS